MTPQSEREIEVGRLDHMFTSELIPGVRISGPYEFEARLCRGHREIKDERRVRVNGPGWSTTIRPDKIEGAIAALEALKEAAASDEFRPPCCIYCGGEVEDVEDARDHYHDEHSDRVPEGEFDRLWYEADPNGTIQQWIRDENRSLSTEADRQ